MRGLHGPRKTSTCAGIVSIVIHVMSLRFWGPRGPRIYFSVSIFYILLLGLNGVFPNSTSNHFQMECFLIVKGVKIHPS